MSNSEDDTYLTQVDSWTPSRAQREAQNEAALVDDPDMTTEELKEASEDYIVLLVIEGHHENLKSQ